MAYYNIDMPLQGDLKTMALEELLQWLHLSEATGHLLFRCPNADVRWRVAGGRLVDVDAPGLDPWARQLFGAENWDKAKNWAVRDNSTPAKVLVRVGLLSPAEAQSWLSDAGRRSLHTIFMWNDGWFLFEQAQVNGDGVDIEHLMLDVAREYDEREQVRGRLGDANAWVEAVPGAILSGLSAAAEALVRQGVHLAELPWLLPDDFWEVSKQIYRLADEGKAILMPAQEDRVGDSLKRYQEAAIAERSFRYEEAAEAFEEAISAAWDDPFVREVVAKWMDRYTEMVHKHLVSPKRRIERLPAAQPAPGDPFAAYVLRTLNRPETLAELQKRAPFHAFYVLRSVRRLAAAGQLKVV